MIGEIAVEPGWQNHLSRKIEVDLFAPNAFHNPPASAKPAGVFY